MTTVNLNMLKKKWVRVILYFHLILFVLLIILGVDIYRTSVNTYEENMSHTPYEAIIVPGIPYDGENWSDLMRTRVLWAKYLYDTGKTSHLIFSGSDVYTPYIESETMAAYAKKLGIPENAILLESEAEHSVENLYFSYKIAKEAGLDSIALATDPIQSYFLMLFANEHDMEVKFLPFQFGMDSIFDVELSRLEIEVPEQKDFVALPDRQSFVDRMKGTLGFHIPRNANGEIQLKE